MKCEEIIKTFEVIRKSGELVFEHYKAMGFVVDFISRDNILPMK